MRKARKPVLPNTLEVSLSPDEREVIVNHPRMLVDVNGSGYLVFSPEQARAFAILLLRKAELCQK